MIDRAKGTFTCDHFPDGEDEVRTCSIWELLSRNEKAGRVVQEALVVDPKVGPVPVLRVLFGKGMSVSCPWCGRCINLRLFEGRCMSTRKLRREHEAGRDRDDRMTERGFRKAEQLAAVLNPLIKTTTEKNRARRAKQKRNGRRAGH